MTIFKKKTAKCPPRHISLFFCNLTIFDMNKITTKPPVLQRNGFKNSCIIVYQWVKKISLTAMPLAGVGGGSSIEILNKKAGFPAFLFYYFNF